MNTRTQPLFFSTPAKLRNWYDKNHDKAAELWLGLYKSGSGEATVSMEEAQTEALCFGWAEGVRFSVSAHQYTIRFCPRKKGSIWSVKNIARTKELIAMDWVHPSGLAIFEQRDEAKSKQYSYEREVASLPPAFEKQFKSAPKAWGWFQTQPLSYRKAALWWIVQPKTEETRLRRLGILIEDSGAGRRVKPLRRPGEK
jgi:uncharacterized protein YdeI (YjbR/CyaY-like superfamily)